MKKKLIDTPKTKLVESELKLPIWSIVAAENVLAMNLTYYQAEQKLMHISDNGATITTNEAAERMLIMQGNINNYPIGLTSNK
jgi:hypothetical protein